MATIDRTTIQLQDATATRLRRLGVYTGPASYATGGDALSAADLGLGRVDVLHLEPLTNGTAILLARYDYTNAKVKVFDMAGAEVSAATNLSTYTARFIADGK